MKTIIAILFALGILAGADPQKFSVEKITTSERSSLDAADAELREAMKAFNLAKANLEEAKDRADRVRTQVVSRFHPFEGDCLTHPSATNFPAYGSATYALPTRSYRRIEIKGTWALITQDTETCNSLTYATTDTVGLNAK